MKKGFGSMLLVVGLVVVLLVLGGAYYFVNKSSSSTVSSSIVQAPASPIVSPSPTLDETANWKTYTNNEYHFSFKYPPELTLQKDDKLVIDSTDFDGQKISVVQYSPSFTTGKLVQSNDPSIKPTQDVSWILINVTPTNGKTIMQEYDNKKGFGDNVLTKVTLLQKYGGADEVADVTNIENHIKTFRKGNYFFDIGNTQSGSYVITGSKYLEKILASFKFTN